MAVKEPPAGGDQDIGYVLIIVVTVTFVPALIAVCLRMYTRARIVYAVGWDDWLMIPAIFSALVASITEIVSAEKGLGRHGFYLTAAEKAEAIKWSDFGQFFCITSLNIGKISMCISLLRIISGSDRRYLKSLLIFMIFLQFAVNVATCTIELVQCNPTSKVWDSTIPGSCWPATVYQDLRYLQASLSAATDYLLAGIPVYLIKNLQMSRKDKTLLCILMGFGSITGIFGIIRCVYLEPYAKTADPTWTNIRALIWGGVERNTGIFVACIPFLRPLRHTTFVKSLLSLTSRTSSRSPKRSGYSVQSYELSNNVNKTSVKDSAASDVSIIEHSGDRKVSTLSIDSPV